MGSESSPEFGAAPGRKPRACRPAIHNDKTKPQISQITQIKRSQIANGILKPVE
jgi:hypothetical protein